MDCYDKRSNLQITFIIDNLLQGMATERCSLPVQNSSCCVSDCFRTKQSPGMPRKSYMQQKVKVQLMTITSSRLPHRISNTTCATNSKQPICLAAKRSVTPISMYRRPAFLESRRDKTPSNAYKVNFQIQAGKSCSKVNLHTTKAKLKPQLMGSTPTSLNQSVDRFSPSPRPTQKTATFSNALVTDHLLYSEFYQTTEMQTPMFDSIVEGNQQSKRISGKREDCKPKKEKQGAFQKKQRNFMKFAELMGDKGENVEIQDCKSISNLSQDRMLIIPGRLLTTESEDIQPSPVHDSSPPISDLINRNQKSPRSPFKRPRCNIVMPSSNSIKNRGSHKLVPLKQAVNSSLQSKEKSIEKQSSGDSRKFTLHFKDARTINSQEDSINSKSNIGMEQSKVIYRRSVGDKISSLHLQKEGVERVSVIEPGTKSPDKKHKQVFRNIDAKECLTLFSIEGEGGNAASQPDEQVRVLRRGPAVSISKLSFWSYAIDVATGMLVVMKEIDRMALQSVPELKDELQCQLSLHASASSQYVLSLYNIVPDSHKYYIICEGGQSTLSNLIASRCKKGNPLTEKQACKYLRRILQGVLWLSSIGITHGYLSSYKVMLCNDLCKFYDFCSAKLGLKNSTHIDIRSAGGIAYELISGRKINWSEPDWSLLHASDQYVWITKNLVECSEQSPISLKDVLSLPLWTQNL